MNKIFNPKYLVFLSTFIYAFTISPSQKEYSELIGFIQADKTNEIQYTEEFDCQDFSEAFIKNATSQGFEARAVMVVLSNQGNVTFHEFVEVSTINGLVWIEPQNDSEYKLSDIGNSLCYTDGQCVAEEIMYLSYE